MSENVNDVSEFRRRGYIIVRGLCPPSHMDAMRKAAAYDLAFRVEPIELEAEVGYPGAPAAAQSRGGDTVRRLRLALGRAPVFRQWALAQPVLAWVRRLLGARDIRLVQAHHNCIMTKHPQFSSSTGWHQDTRYWSFEQGELVNAWTALGHEAPDNGGMRIIPGSHRMVFGTDRFDEQKFFREVHPDNERLIESAVQIDLEPGDVLFFHAGLLHTAGRNRAGECKYSVVFSYHAADNRPVEGTHSASLPGIDPEEE